MQILSVGKLADYLRSLLESDELLADIWVSGEISNLYESQAKHLYFTIKDADGQLKCVLFKTDRPDINLEDGMAVVAHGRVSYYGLRGDIQFYVDLIQAEGVGLLHLEYQRLKDKLENEGLFDPVRKRTLPYFPTKIGIVTSPSSAAFQDIINIISRRYPLAEIVLSPTLVQGAEAVSGILNALNRLNNIDDIDVVILARGGGSIEDLWAFNEEAVARAIYASKAPLISGVGHDTDFTITDFVADVRAPTPSSAAELAVPDSIELKNRIETFKSVITTSMHNSISELQEKLKSEVYKLKAPEIVSYRQQIDDYCISGLRILDNTVVLRRSELRSHSLQLGSLNPVNTLNRGYALIQKKLTGEIVHYLSQVTGGDTLDIRISDGKFSGKVTGRKKDGRQGTLI